MSTITEKNEYGEEIHINLENGIVMVHHTDATEGFITLNDLMLNYVLSIDELKSIYNAIKTLQHGSASANVLQFFKL